MPIGYDERTGEWLLSDKEKRVRKPVPRIPADSEIDYDRIAAISEEMERRAHERDEARIRLCERQLEYMLADINERTHHPFRWFMGRIRTLLWNAMHIKEL